MASPQKTSIQPGDEQKQAAPTISLPKGGGAIRGIGEKFAANPVTGTGSMSIPIAVSGGRSGFGPQISLSYDSGAANGPFGFGWSLSLPSITRKTDKGLPQYRDAEESDVFILSGAEDLVPLLKEQDNDWIAEDLPDKKIDNETYRIKRYRPRTEGLFSRIERWSNRAQPEDTFWRSISKDNITSWYGKSDNSRVADGTRIFCWLICESYDDKGNVIIYDYKPEDSAGIDQSQAHERNRTDHTRKANRYLKRVRYGNHEPHFPILSETESWPTPRGAASLDASVDWLFEVVFDYGEHDADVPMPLETGNAWARRNDPFSSYRPGFEVRTYRLCQRVLMFHHFPNEQDVGANCLVRSTDFTYSYEEDPNSAQNPIFSYLLSVSQSGYQRQQNGYVKKSLPRVEFDYSQVPTAEQLARRPIYEVDTDSLQNLPVGLDSGLYQWIDLDGDGTYGVLTEQADGWYYKRNLSANNQTREDGHERTVACFGPTQLVASKPASGLAGAQFLDLGGDGQVDLVQMEGPERGFYERTDDGSWMPFQPFVSWADVNTRGPDLRFVDLTGDGHADILITDDETLTWYPSLAEEGFGRPIRVSHTLDEEKGPRLVFSDGTQSIYLADLSGDGLTDLVRIRNGEVCYWPNLGYGQFGSKVTMDNAPWFDSPDQFDQRRIRVADIDGSGTTDILYLRRDGVQIYFNQSGNRWSDAVALPQLPPSDNVSSVQALDLLGNGTACLVWSSPLPGAVHQPMSYLALMDEKPHLLVGVKNNLGAETNVHYAPSTKFYLDDTRAGRPWITWLPFPVHVVDRVETYDYISPNYFVTRYAYHHGYFDGEEREFRGFGMVEQWDTEEFEALQAGGGFPPSANIDESSNVPPALTRTWFHNGAYVAQDNISQHFLDEYYKKDSSATFLPDTTLPTGLTTEEQREACRALKGRMLRQEIYADDNSAQSEHPYSVTEHTYHLRLIQPMLDNAHAVFYAYESEALAYHYEREPADPRITHQLTLEVDEFGNAIKSAAIGYARRPPPIAQPAHSQEQASVLITYTENQVTNKSSEADWYRIGVPIETRTYELTGIVPTDNKPLTTDALLTDLGSATEIQYEDAPNHTLPQKRLIERVLTHYLKDDLSGPSPFGEVESRALTYESYKQAFTSGLLEVYQSKIATADLIDVLQSVGRYRDLYADGSFWISSGRSFFSPVPQQPTPSFTQDPAFAQQHFYLIQATQDAFGSVSRITYDSYDLLLIGTEDALGNVVVARNDYRVMQPALVTDPNGNRAAVGFDELGFIVATAVMGKADESDPANTGDTLEDPTTRLAYSLFEWADNDRPNFVHTLAREQHGVANPRWQESYSYSDGFGREIQKKIQAEPGEVDGVRSNPRWVGSGWTIFNNKGKPVKQYEPFFSNTHEFEFKKQGVSSTLFYDPLERVVATLHPNHTYEKIIFNAWRQDTWDVNDTVLRTDPKSDPNVGDFFRRLEDVDYLPTWYESHTNSQQGADRDAASKAAAHSATPAIAHFDTLGRPFLTIANNGKDAHGEDLLFETSVELDVEGNQRSVTDALGRIHPQRQKVMTYDYDMLGNKIHQVSMDAGERWMLSDVAGKPIHVWDSRDHHASHEYDALQRPVRSFVQTGDGAKILAERIVYGEAHSDAEALNLRGKIFMHLDSAGANFNVARNPQTDQDEAYDFKGNLLRSTRQLARDYRQQVDWLGVEPALNVAPDAPLNLEAITDALAPFLTGESFNTSTTYDALNRPITLTTPDGSVVQPIYNEANFLERLGVALRGAESATEFVTNIDYNEKGQRKLVEYNNQTRTEYEYDDQTFRLINLKTTRTTDNALLQSLSYTYDPVGNITAIRDASQPTIFYNNDRVEPLWTYAYDALYRLTLAEGREHAGQTNYQPTPPRDNYRDFPFLNGPNANDSQAMRNYAEEYEYDSVGNILSMIHQAADGNWTQRYDYAHDSNRLLSTSLPGDSDSAPYSARYEYDAHGNMTRMLHLPLMQWDFKDQLQATSQQVVNGGTPETTYYVYNAAGQRVRKVTEAQADAGRTPTRTKERIYLGGFEIYREYNGNGSTPTLERETMHIMDDKRRVALVETKTIDSTAPVNTLPSTLTRYQFDNHLGSACLELDESGAIISYEEYYPYGCTSYQAGRNAAEVSLKRYRYTGKERDEETGLYYYGARYYAPWLGRWTKCDPAELVDGPNLYAYVRNCPVLIADFTGKQGRRPSYEERMAGTVGFELLNATTKGEGIDAIEELMPKGRAAESVEEDQSSPVMPEPRALVPSPTNKVLDQAFAAQGGKKDWVEVDLQATDERGRPVWNCHTDDPASCRVAHYIDLPVGTSDVELQLALGGIGELLGVAKWSSEAAEVGRAESGTFDVVNNSPGPSASTIQTEPRIDLSNLESNAKQPVRAFPASELPQRAADISSRVDEYLRSGLTDPVDINGVNKVTNGLTVGIAQPIEEPSLRIVTFTNPKVHDLFLNGQLTLGSVQLPGETLILGPRPILSGRKTLWHAEVGGALAWDALGSEGGYAAASRPGCFGCTEGFGSTPNWTHMNPGAF
jgi:RHS repeat-associated protein